MPPPISMRRVRGTWKRRALVLILNSRMSGMAGGCAASGSLPENASSLLSAVDPVSIQTSPTTTSRIFDAAPSLQVTERMRPSDEAGMGSSWIRH